MKSPASLAPLLLVCLCASIAAQAKVLFSFDYSMDSSGLFDPSTSSGRAAQAAMDRAGQVFSDRILDNLSAIAPTSGDTWSPQIVNPGTGATVAAPLTSEAANVIKVYVGSRTLSGTDVGNTVMGFGTASGSQAFMESAQARGQTGALSSPKTDYGPWGGSVAFDDSTPWYFGLTPGGLSAGKVDFLSVATHELEHLLGFSASQPSWAALVASGKFTGSKATAANGGINPIVTGSHWLGMSSTVGPNGPVQIALMDSGVPTGVRRHITQLDWAALDDIGWDLAMPGDANADGIVNFVDFQALEVGFGATNARWSQGDFNEDGMVDTADLSLLLQNYGKRWNGSAAAPSAAEERAIADFSETANVPEPGVGALLCLLAFPLLRRRRLFLR